MATGLRRVEDGPGVRGPLQEPRRQELSGFTSFVVGMHDRPSRTAYDGQQLGLQVWLDPLGACSLLGVPLTSCGTGWSSCPTSSAPTPNAGRTAGGDSSRAGNRRRRRAGRGSQASCERTISADRCR